MHGASLFVSLWLIASSVCGCSFFAPTLDEYARPIPRDAGTGDAAADACADDACSPLVCPPSYADCNGDRSDGCEQSVLTVSHCGSCDSTCTNQHGVTDCRIARDAGAICVPTCMAGFADCDLNPNNGCETNTNSDSVNCGTCGMVCPSNGGTPLCQGGKCGLAACNPGFGDCANNGVCNIDLNRDVANCGRCGHVCSDAHGAPLCNGGVCEIKCDSGWGDCNQVDVDGGAAPDDGCETQLNQPDSGGSVPNCGACGASCTRRSLTTVDLEQCALGICARNCAPGFADCDNNRNVAGCNGSSCGCEVRLATDPKNCGKCGTVCASGTCTNGVCQ